jgi:DNA-binding XRE family transcriptional regulator
MNVHQKIKDMRTQLGLSQAQLGQIAGYSQSNISCAEKGSQGSGYIAKAVFRFLTEYTAKRAAETTERPKPQHPAHHHKPQYALNVRTHRAPRQRPTHTGEPPRLDIRNAPSTMEQKARDWRAG